MSRCNTKNSLFICRASAQIVAMIHGALIALTCRSVSLNHHHCIRLAQIMNQPASVEQRFTVYYDGACPLCSKEIETYQKARGADELAWVDAANADSKTLGQDLDCAAALARMHVRDESGKLISGAAAFAAIWARLPKTRWLGRLMGTRPALWVLEPAYGVFLKIRPLWRATPPTR